MMRRILYVAILAGAVALVAAGTWMLLDDDAASSGDVTAVEDALRPSATTIPVAEPTPTPSTTAPPDSPADDTSPPAEVTPVPAPVRLRIGKLDVDAQVAAYGVDQETGQMAVPENVTEVGWYRFGPSPGEPGSAVLAAHVDLAGSGPGVFFELNSLEEGDRISVLHEDGSESAFVVVARATYDKEELPLDVIFSREGSPVLTLITCGGGFNRTIARYDSNVVVYAVPDPGTELTEPSTL
jgi:sortase (surface protein transpeptidase)